jgi:GTPase SAR1 family protein
VVDLTLSRATLHFWDLGGDASLRRIWTRYYDEADVFVWAMDSQDWIDLVVTSDAADSNEGEKEVRRSREARRNESWDTLASLRSQSHHLTSLPLLLIFTQFDKVDWKGTAIEFSSTLKSILQEKFDQLAKAEETELEEEMNQLDHTMEGKDYRRHIWKDWQVLTCSAKDGTGAGRFVDWLHSHANTTQER